MEGACLRLLAATMQGSINYNQLLMTDELAYYYALWRMKQLPPEDLPKIACDALERGLDSSALRYLAGLQRPTSRDIGKVFDDACSQLGIVPASPKAVEQRQEKEWIWNATQIAKQVSAQIVNGTLDPVEGWFRLPHRDGDLGPVSIFFEFADRCSNVSFDEQFRARMIKAAKTFQSTSK
jgi:hypothetical protein